MYSKESLTSFLLLALLVLPSPATAAAAAAAAVAVDPVDFLALQAIRRSLRDLPGSSFLASWDFTIDPCRFPGVFCGGGRVVALSLGDPRAGAPGLTGRLDPALGRLSALAELSLVPGRVYGPIPAALSRCSSLRFLALSRNLLSGPIPASFSSLRRLRTLDLSSNLISGAIPRLPLPSIATLILSHNRIAGGIPHLQNSSQLTRLDLNGNLLSGALPPLPSSLIYLSLSFNHLSGGINAVLPALSRLTYLALSANQFSGPLPPSIFSLPLSSLRLQRNRFSGEIRSGGGPGIPVVDLSHNSLTGQVPAALAAGRRVYLNDNGFEGVLPAAFAEGLAAGRIEVLYLQRNYLTGMEGMRSVAPGSSLCLQINCMTPPAGTPCPLRTARRRPRPRAQCLRHHRTRE